MNKVIRAAVGFMGNKLVEESKGYTFDDVFQSLSISKPATPDDVMRLDEWLVKNRSTSITMYYSCSLNRPILTEGILVKSRNNPLNYTTTGYVPLFITQDDSVAFAKRNSYYGTPVMYSVDIPVSKLKCDLTRAIAGEYMEYSVMYDKINTELSVGGSLILGGSAYVKVNIPPKLITKI